MRIAILHAGDMESLALGGVDQYIKNIIRDRGEHDIFIYGTSVCDNYILGNAYKINKGGLSYTFIPISDNSKYPLTLYYMIKELQYVNDICTYDVIYCQRIELTLPFFFCKKAKSKLIQIIHGSSSYTTMHWGRWKRLIYELIERVSIQTAKRTFVVLMRDEFGVPYYQKKYKKYREKICYARIPVNTEKFFPQNKMVCREELGLPQEAFIIMYGGRVEHAPKRVLLFPDIIKKLLLDEKNIYFIVIGDGNDLNKLQEKFAQLVPKENYKMMGYIEDRTVLAKYINACDLNINISEFEGTCTSSLEAIACGIPVLSTDVGDIKLFVSENKNGFIIENNNDEQIINDSVSKIKEMMEKGINMTDAFMVYDCQTVTKDLFQEFQSISSL